MHMEQEITTRREVCAGRDETLSLETVLKLWKETSAPVMQALKQWVDELLAGAGRAICNVAPAQGPASTRRRSCHEVIPTWQLLFPTRISSRIARHAWSRRNPKRDLAVAARDEVTR